MRSRLSACFSPQARTLPSQTNWARSRQTMPPTRKSSRCLLEIEGRESEVRWPMKLPFLALALFEVCAHAENWPQWRGPRLDGTSAETQVPVHWSATSNVLWKTELPGAGHASPIVFGDKVFTVSAVAQTEERLLLCLDAASGKILWQQPVIRSPLEKKHSLNSHASSTPACDGNRVFVAFLDVSEMVVAAYDLNGKQEWLVRPGPFHS